MSQVETTAPEQDHPAEKIAIKVNDDPVAVTDKQQTGASIKAAAIEQGVPIEADFDLSEVLPNDKQKPIADEKNVEVKDGDEFWAIPGDDNS
jgi:Multiubiquitin